MWNESGEGSGVPALRRARRAGKYNENAVHDRKPSEPLRSSGESVPSLETTADSLRGQ